MMQLGSIVGVYRLTTVGDPGMTLWLRGPIPLSCAVGSLMHVVPPTMPHCLCETVIVAPEPDHA